MAHVTGTASSLRDVVDQIRTVMTTSSALAAQVPSQLWQELRYVYDNIESASTNMNPSAGKYVQSICRVDPRLRFSDTLISTSQDFVASGLIGGSSVIVLKFRTAKPVSSILLKAHSTTSTAYNLNSFRLQYSDNGTSWTTAATITGQTGWGIHEERTFSGWAATGSHLWWRVVIDSVGNNSTTSGPVYIRTLLMYSGTEIVNSSESHLIVKGPGLGGSDEIFIGFTSRANPLTSEEVIMIHGFTGYQPTERSMLGQPGVVPYGQPFMALWDQPMPFWISVNGRRIVGNFKVASNYMGFYAGFFLPYATAGQYPYPLAVGGSICSRGFDNTTLKYDIISAAHSVFCMPGSVYAGTSVTNINNTSTLSVMQPTGVWESYMNRPITSGTQYTETIQYEAAHCVAPQYMWDQVSASSSQRKPCYDNIGGGYTLWPHVLVNVLPIPKRLLGELDGTKQVSGQNNSSENTGTIDGKNYVIFQNIYRSARTEYWAMIAE